MSTNPMLALITASDRSSQKRSQARTTDMVQGMSSVTTTCAECLWNRKSADAVASARPIHMAKV